MSVAPSTCSKAVEKEKLLEAMSAVTYLFSFTRIGKIELVFSTVRLWNANLHGIFCNWIEFPSILKNVSVSEETNTAIGVVGKY